jgi:hypothetical protein
VRRGFGAFELHIAHDDLRGDYVSSIVNNRATSRS